MVTPRSFIPTSLLLPALLALHAPAAGAAAPRCEPRVLSHTNRTWSEPLTRPVSVNAGEIPLKDALERVALAAHLRFSYSAEVLPLDKRVCASYESSAVGDVLVDLLRGVLVEPVVAGNDHVVLAPSSTRIAHSDDPIPSPVYPLLPLIATATPAEPAANPVNYATTLISRESLSQQGSMSEALNARVPGLWAWQSPGGFTTTFSSRGASSFGLSAPKVFIDGIEVANPLLLAQISPDNVERIEVIRGPEGAALYGADALSGVTNIITRHAWSSTGMARLHARTGVAFSGSDYMGGASVGQEHSIGVQVGTRARSGDMNFTIGTIGEYLPGAFSRQITGDGSFRVMGSRTMLSGTARVYNKTAGNPASIITEAAPAGITPLSMTQFTMGLKGVVQQGERWTHSFVAGVDGYSLGNIASDTTAPLSATDSLLRAWDGGIRTTLRYSSVAQLTGRHDFNGTLTIAAEHSGLHQSGNGTAALDYAGTYNVSGERPSGVGYGLARDSMERFEHGEEQAGASGDYQQARSSNGVSLQLDGGFHKRFFINGGLRIEHDAVNDASEGTAALPMLGASYVLGGSALRVKLHAAYGKSVRWPDLPRPEPYWEHGRMVRPALSPEQQSGIETGVDISVHQNVGLQITHYDQSATGLSQLVALQQSGKNAQNQMMTWTVYALQSVGEIANRGWEAQAYARRGPLSLAATASLTDSRVQRVATGYSGDLRAGDRMLAVPARTMSLTAGWQAHSWSTSVTAMRAFDWINYDRAALVRLPQQPTGDALRSYWQQYNGFTHLRASFSHNLTRGFVLQLAGDNLLGGQLGEPDNLTVVPGRTISFGIRASF